MSLYIDISNDKFNHEDPTNNFINLAEAYSEEKIIAHLFFTSITIL